MSYSDAILRSAKRLHYAKDLESVADVWKKEQVELILSYGLDQGDKIHAALMKYHAVQEFANFVEQLAQEAGKE